MESSSDDTKPQQLVSYALFIKSSLNPTPKPCIQSSKLWDSKIKPSTRTTKVPKPILSLFFV